MIDFCFFEKIPKTDQCQYDIEHIPNNIKTLTLECMKEKYFTDRKLLVFYYRLLIKQSYDDYKNLINCK